MTAASCQQGVQPHTTCTTSYQGNVVIFNWKPLKQLANGDDYRCFIVSVLRVYVIMPVCNCVSGNVVDRRQENVEGWALVRTGYIQWMCC